MINKKYLRREKAKYFEKFEKICYKIDDEILYDNYNNAIILPLRKVEGDNLLFGRGGVIDENNTYISNSCISGRIEKAYSVKEYDYIDEKVVYCGFLVNHWGHFLIEAVSQLWYFVQNDSSEIKHYVFFIEENVNREIIGNYKEFLELLGVWSKILIINKPTKFKEVTIPDLSYKRMDFFSDKYRQIFEIVANNIVVDNSWKKKKRIYFTRTAFGNSNLTDIGAQVLDVYFKRNDFSIISPERMCLSELIFYIRNCEVCAAISGTLPHNMLFANDGQKVLIMERQTLINEIQIDLNIVKKLEAIYIDSNYAVYPVSCGNGPFIIAYSKQLEKFTKDNFYKEVDKEYLSDRYNRCCLREYMKMYYKRNTLSCAIEPWGLDAAEYLYEAYAESMCAYGKYINGEKLLFWYQIFSKKMIKKILCRILNKGNK